MKYKWISTSTAGIRFREHTTRKHGKRPDRYFVIRYQKEGKTIQEALGWASSEGVTQAIATERLAEIKRNIRKGEGPQSLNEKREISKKKREAEIKAAKQAKRDNMTVSDTWALYGESNSDKKSASREESIFKVHIKPVIGPRPLKDVAAIRSIRDLLEHRAIWMYVLCDEAAKKGLDWEDFAPVAIKRCGLFQGDHLVAKGGTRSLKGLKKTLFTKPAQWVFEMKVQECSDDQLSIDFHYCPLVKAWQKQGCSDDDIARLCDIAMSGDRGIAESYGCVMDLPKSIARGDDVCEIRFRRPGIQPKLSHSYRFSALNLFLIQPSTVLFSVIPSKEGIQL